MISLKEKAEKDLINHKTIKHETVSQLNSPLSSCNKDKGLRALNQ